MAIQAVSVPTKRLATSILSTDMSFQLNNILSWKGLVDGTTNLTSADFPARGFGAFRNSTNTQIELFEFDPTTIASASITIVSRGLSYSGGYVDGGTTKYNWNANETLIELGTDGPQVFQLLRDYIDAISIAGAANATTSLQGLVELATQAEYDAGTATGGTGASIVATPAIARGKKYNDYAVDSVGTDDYAITPTPAITAYVAGQEFTFKAGTANTGACTLAVSGLTAKTIKKDVSLDLATGDILANQIVHVVYDGANFQLQSQEAGVKNAAQLTGLVPLASLPIPIYQQAIPCPIQDGASGLASGSNTDGSVLYIVHQFAATELFRYARDSASGMYYQTHAVNMTTPIPSSDFGAIILIGSNIYVFANDGTNINCFRYSADDLTGEQAMTVPTVASTSVTTAWTDGTFAYVVSSASATTARKWSVAGTVFSAVNTAVAPSNTFDQTSMSSMWDGTFAYVVQQNLGNTAFAINKITNITGTTVSLTTKTVQKFSDAHYGGIIVPFDATRLYIGTISSDYNATAVNSAKINLIPVTKP